MTDLNPRIRSAQLSVTQLKQVSLDEVSLAFNSAPYDLVGAGELR